VFHQLDQIGHVSSEAKETGIGGQLQASELILFLPASNGTVVLETPFSLAWEPLEGEAVHLASTIQTQFLPA
jgi:hypothetical protein